MKVSISNKECFIEVLREKGPIYKHSFHAQLMPSGNYLIQTTMNLVTRSRIMPCTITLTLTPEELGIPRIEDPPEPDGEGHPDGEEPL